jgi:hypothetical protein
LWIIKRRDIGEENAIFIDLGEAVPVCHWKRNFYLDSIKMGAMNLQVSLLAKDGLGVYAINNTKHEKGSQRQHDSISEKLIM